MYFVMTVPVQLYKNHWHCPQTMRSRVVLCNSLSVSPFICLPHTADAGLLLSERAVVRR